MPKGTKVALKVKGKKGHATVVAKAVTKLSLATGKKPKYKNAMLAANDGDNSVIKGIREE